MARFKKRSEYRNAMIPVVTNPDGEIELYAEGMSEREIATDIFEAWAELAEKEPCKVRDFKELNELLGFELDDVECFKLERLDCKVARY